MEEMDATNLDQLLAESDRLLQKIDSELCQDLSEEQRLQLEIQLATLAETKAKLENYTSQAGEGFGRVSDGIHEAIDDLVIEAIQETARILN
ncbi:MAG: hypothetical protein WBV21_09705 [Desulfobacterales bacterium]